MHDALDRDRSGPRSIRRAGSPDVPGPGAPMKITNRSWTGDRWSATHRTPIGCPRPARAGLTHRRRLSPLGEGSRGRGQRSSFPVSALSYPQPPGRSSRLTSHPLGPHRRCRSPPIPPPRSAQKRQSRPTTPPLPAPAPRRHRQTLPFEGTQRLHAPARLVRGFILPTARAVRIGSLARAR